MAPHAPAYTTKELSTETWPDFVKLFTRGNGWDFCWCIHFQRARSLPKSEWLPTRAERGVRNRREKRTLVDRGQAHGILVYAEGEPVGWCQYGPQEELPRFDSGRLYRALAPAGSGGRIWRISCFAVDKRFRRRGVAGAALAAALESIRKKGGGVVEAFPIPNWKNLRPAEVRRRGHAPSFGNVSTHGTVSMFEKRGFKVVGRFGNINVLMRTTV